MVSLEACVFQRQNCLKLVEGKDYGHPVPQIFYHCEDLKAHTFVDCLL